MAEDLLVKMSEGPNFVQKFEQSEPIQIPEAEQLSYVAPLKSVEMLDYLKEPAEWGKSVMSGLAWGPGALLKTVSNFLPESAGKVSYEEDPLQAALGVEQPVQQAVSFRDAIIEPAIDATERAVEWWDPKSDAPGQISQWVRAAMKSSGQSVSAGLSGAAAAVATGAVGIPTVVIGAILAKGATFGGAQWYDLTHEIEKEAIKQGATPAEVALIQQEAAAWKAVEAGAEMGGEYFSDFISARVFGLTGNPAISAPVKQAIRSTIIKYSKKMGLNVLAQNAGEVPTTVAQYVGHEKIFKDIKEQPEFWKQIEDTVAVTSIQSLIMGAGASAVASTRAKSTEAFEKDFKTKAAAVLVNKGVDKNTADTIADTIIKHAKKEDAVDAAIGELEDRSKAMKATKEERVAKKDKRKVEAAKKTQEVLNIIMAPEPTEQLTPVATEPTAREEKLAKLKSEPQVPVVEGLKYNGIQETPGMANQYVFTEEKTGSTFYTTDLSIKHLEAEISRIQKAFRVAEIPIQQETLPKTEVTFIKLVPSENAELPDVIVEDRPGHPMVFNPDVHLMDEANMKAAQRSLTTWGPTAVPKEETTRERRLRILTEAGRIKPAKETVAAIDAAPFTTEVVDLVKKTKPGLVEHIEAMSRKGWSVDDFINDPDVKADLEGIISEDKYYDLILDIKNAVGAMTSVDILDKQIREEQRNLDADLAEIDKMKNEDRMQGEPPVYEEYYDPETSKWIRAEKEEIVDVIENEFVEPPPTIEKVPIKVHVPTETKKVFSRKVVDNTTWYQPREEAMTQLNLLRQVKMDWNIDVDTLLHAVVTNTNVAYHMKGQVPFAALARIEDNMKHFRDTLSQSEFTRFGNAIDSVRKFMVDVSDAIKATDEVLPANPTKDEKYNTFHRFHIAQQLMNTLSEGNKNATHLIEFMLNRTESFSEPLVALAQHFNTPAIRQILNKVGANISAYSATTDTNIRVFFRVAKNEVGFDSKYASYAIEHMTSVGEDILHEITHALTVDLVRNNRAIAAAVRNLRLKAIDGLNENDRRVLLSFAGKPAKFYEKPTNELGFSGTNDMSVYYGLNNDEEFLANALTTSEFQEFLGSIPYEVQTGGPIKTLWDRFKEILSLAIFNRYPGERESTLLDAVLNVSNRIIEMQAASTHAQLAFEARERSTYASTPRLKSVDIEHTLQSTSLKGPGVHAGIETPAQQKIFITEKPVDVSRLSTYIESPLFALRDFPEARSLAEQAIDALGTWGYNRSLGFMEIDRITKDLTKTEREKVTSILKNIEGGEVINLDTLSPNIKKAVVDTRNFLDVYKAKHQKFLRESIVLSSNITEAHILADVMISGMSVIGATKKWNRYARHHNKTDEAGKKMPTTTYADVLEILKEWKETRNFGIENYITHAMRGSIALVDPDGKVVSFAQTKRQAVKEALRYLTEHPEIKALEVDTTYRLDKDIPTLVSQKQYRVMKGKIASIVNKFSKEINKDLADQLKTALPGKAIAVKPKKVWSQFLQEREEELPGERDVFDILPLYVHSIEKKHAVDPYVLKLREELPKFSGMPNVKKVLEDQLEAIRGQYTSGDAILDDIFTRLGIETSFSYTRGLGATRTVLTNLKLGYRPVASIINLLSGMGHTWIKTSAKYMIEAKKTLATEGGKEFIKKNAPSLGTSIVEGMGGDLENRLNWYSPLKLFQAPEIPNRELSFMSSYLFGRGEFGYDEATAVEFAKRSVDTQQFNYSVAGVPEILRGPGAKTIGQFKAYLVKEIEFIRGLKGPNQWAKYLTMQAVLGGPRGIMITLKSLPFLALAGGDRWFDELDAWLNNNYPKLSRGVFGFFGIDASAPASFQFPEKASDWAGVLISEIIKFGRDVVQPFVDGESYLWEDVKKFSKGAVPIWRMWSEFFDGLMSPDGWILDEHGNNKYKVEDWTDFFKFASGFKPLKMSVQELELQMERTLQDRERAQANKIVEQIVKRSRLIDVDIVTEELVNEVAMHAISPDTIIAAIERSHLDPSTRQLLKTKMTRRMEIWQRQLPTRKFLGQ